LNPTLNPEANLDVPHKPPTINAETDNGNASGAISLIIGRVESFGRPVSS
jgi:hypothetical protein